MKKPIIIFLALLLLLAGSAQASRPVHKTVTGCVIGGVLYDLYEFSDAAGKRTITAYPLTIKGLDLSRYEGRKVSVEGYLLPGDRFNPIPNTLKALGPCDKKSRAVISGR
ncbi:MAG: hypothetical protein AB9866_21965 [Syntrophobacteraceae bacterium]